MKLITFTRRKYSNWRCHRKRSSYRLKLCIQAKLQNEGKYRYKEIAEAYIPAKMETFLQGGDESLAYAKEAVAFAKENPASFKYPLVYRKDEVKFEAPVTNPGKIVCVGHNYREHILEMKEKSRQIQSFLQNLRTH